MRDFFDLELLYLDVSLSLLLDLEINEDMNWIQWKVDLLLPTAHDTLDPRILKLWLKYNSLSLKGKSIAFAWIPSHVGIDCNDMADELAKSSLSYDVTPGFKLPY